MPKFVKFKKALLNGTKEKMVKEHVNMTEKDEVVISQTLPPKLKDPGKFIISCNIGEVNILHALCDLEFSINVTLSNMTLTIDDSFVAQPVSILCDVLEHVGELVFPVDFVVMDTKGD